MHRLQVLLFSMCMFYRHCIKVLFRWFSKKLFFAKSFLAHKNKFLLCHVPSSLCSSPTQHFSLGGVVLCHPHLHFENIKDFHTIFQRQFTIIDKKVSKAVSKCLLAGAYIYFIWVFHRNIKLNFDVSFLDPRKQYIYQNLIKKQ